ncbi:hypothetical protein CDAR_538751 [Caerostris darwini]|uniref:Uncharacterized protein n=1 Tax=Caerostris darwini TaxID=1538125 RepID=A0AAV4SYG0_9ARAC|nr:hypothetical protein CDAR_538751 [Caerostris darwini]
MKAPLGRESETPNSIPLSDLRIHPQHEAKDLIRRPPNPKGWPAIKRSPTTNAETMNNLIIPLIPLLSSPSRSGMRRGWDDFAAKWEGTGVCLFSDGVCLLIAEGGAMRRANGGDDLARPKAPSLMTSVGFDLERGPPPSQYQLGHPNGEA